MLDSVEGVIVGVDESGDFRAGSRGFFAAAFIRPSQRESVAEALRGWERAVRKDLSLSTEVKGSALTDEWIARFVTDVLTVGRTTPVSYLAFAVDASEPIFAAMEVQRDKFVRGYEDWAALVVERSGGEEAKFAKSLHGQASWMRAMAPIPLLKLMTLGAIVPELVEWSVAVSASREFDEELDRLRIMIDGGYIKPDDLFRWRDILRNIFIGYTHDNPLPMLDTWDEDHPFVAKFIEQQREGGVIVLSPAFKETIDFYNSERTPEVRIADVIAAVVRRTDGGDRLDSYEALRELSLRPERYKLIEWSTLPRPTSWDPYVTPEV